jgi:hypothetical protein
MLRRPAFVVHLALTGRRLVFNARQAATGARTREESEGWLRLEQPACSGQGHQLRPVLGAQLGEEGGDVVLDGAGGDKQGLGNRLVGLALGK